MGPVNLSTFKLGLIGYPLGHSLSPKIHRAALKSCGLAGSYSRFPIPPDDRQGLTELLGCVRSGEIHGLNVTIPHKQSVIELLDELTPTAKAISAVNTIYMQDDGLIGDNTDAPGFLIDLKKSLTTESRSHGERNALVLGAGGSARAVVYALINHGWNVTIAARRIEQAQRLARHFEGTTAVELNVETFERSNVELIVNTTPVGMFPNVDRSPVPENAVLSGGTFVYDLVYNPRETKLVRDARLQGIAATTGLGMLIEQAALAFERWTGHSPRREALWTAVEN